MKIPFLNRLRLFSNGVRQIDIEFQQSAVSIVSSNYIFFSYMHALYNYKSIYKDSDKHTITRYAKLQAARASAQMKQNCQLLWDKYGVNFLTIYGEKIKNSTDNRSYIKEYNIITSMINENL